MNEALAKAALDTIEKLKAENAELRKALGITTGKVDEGFTLKSSGSPLAGTDELMASIGSGPVATETKKAAEKTRKSRS